MQKLHGVHTALITPFDAAGSLDVEGLRQNIRYQLENKIDGLVVLGTTGETPTLTQKEKEIIVNVTLEENRGQAVVGVGTGSYSTQQAIENTQRIEAAGADYALVVSPYYNRPTQEGLYLHFKAIAASVNMPIMLYNIAGRTGVNIQTETLKKLADIPNIIGVKEASGNILQMMDVLDTIRTCRPDFKVFSGDDSLTYPLMAMGGHGIISVVSNLLPQRIKAMVQSIGNGDYAAAGEIHFSLLNIFKTAFIETNPMPMKYLMQLWEMPAGGCRLPLCELMQENKIKLQQCIRQYESFRPVSV